MSRTRKYSKSFLNLRAVVSHLETENKGICWIDGQNLRPQDFLGYMVTEGRSLVGDPVCTIETDSDADPEQRLKIVFVGGAIWSLPIQDRPQKPKPR